MTKLRQKDLSFFLFTIKSLKFIIGQRILHSIKQKRKNAYHQRAKPVESVVWQVGG